MTVGERPLTPRQITILAAWWRHTTIKAAANNLGLSPQTVKNHLAAMRHKTGETTAGLTRIYWNEIAEFGDQPRLTPRKVRYRVDSEWANRQRAIAREGMRKARALEAGRRAEIYQELLDKQQGRCAICGKHESEQVLRSGKLRRLALDHDHAGGGFRGLLCLHCNVMLGNAGDDPKRLEEGARYLRRHAQGTSHNTGREVA